MQFLLPNPVANPLGFEKFTSKETILQDGSNLPPPSLLSLAVPDGTGRRRSRTSAIIREEDVPTAKQVRFKRTNTSRPSFTKFSDNPGLEAFHVVIPGNNSNSNLASEKTISAIDMVPKGGSDWSKLTSRNRLSQDEVMSFQGTNSKTTKDFDSANKEEDQVKNTVDNRLSDQCLLFVSKEARSASVGALPKKPFQSFKDLAGKVKESQQALMNNFQQYNALQNTLKKNEVKGQLVSVRKLLEFNKQQQSHYNQEARSAREHFMLPLIRRQSEEGLRKKKMPPVRVYPFMNSFHQPASLADVNIKANSFARETPGILDEVQKETEENESTWFQAQYKFFWRPRDMDYGLWRPEVREGHSLTAIGKKLVLYGGMSTASIQDVAVYSTVTQRWTKPDVSGEPPSMGRHGHSACALRKGVVIFGGQRQYNAVLNYRECLNDVRIFTAKNEWEYLRPNGKSIEGRRNHAAAVYHSNMYVYGGINIDGKYLSDVWAFNLKTQLWNQLDAEYDRDAGLAYHTMASCFEMKPPKVYKEGELNTKVTVEGLYVFGGRDEEGKSTNAVKILSIAGRKYSWVYPSLKGAPPAARYGHTMTVCEELGLLMIYGGKSENCLKMNDHSEFTEIFVLSLSSMMWLTPTSLGQTPMIPRYSHAATMVGSCMVIFGGLEPGEYAKDSLAFAEINQNEVRKLATIEKTEEEIAKRTPSPIKKQGNSILKEPSIFGMEDFDKTPIMPDQVDDTTFTPGKPIASWLPFPNSRRIKRGLSTQRTKEIMKRVVNGSGPLTERGTSSSRSKH